MTVQRQQNVIELQVAINDAILVEVLQGQADFGSIELSSLGTKLSPLNVQHEITSTDILHDEVDARLSLEAGMQVKQERMMFLVGNQEHSLLGSCALDFVILDDKLLFEDLDSI
jgi:hypothetical protein